MNDVSDPLDNAYDCFAAGWTVCNFGDPTNNFVFDRDSEEVIVVSGKILQSLFTFHIRTCESLTTIMKKSFITL
jgi:hypothetical protein